MTKELFLYSEQLFWPMRAKFLLKRLAGKQLRGPYAVEHSLRKGLMELNVPFKINYRPSSPVDCACVLSGPKAVRWAIKQKKAGLFSRVAAGPNIIVSVNDEGGLLKDPLIDLIIVPSQWVADFYASQAPEIAKKIRIWPAGVVIPEVYNGKKQFDFLVYNKIGKDKLAGQICSYLEQKGLTFKVLNYGSFSQEDYFKALGQCSYEIYLSGSESQGLAMFEAWARNVPTLVWEKGLWEANGDRWQGASSAPYLSQQSGERFRSIIDFPNSLEKFMANRYSPREYAEQNFSNKVCAQKYLDIINA